MIIFYCLSFTIAAIVFYILYYLQKPYENYSYPRQTFNDLNFPSQRVNLTDHAETSQTEQTQTPNPIRSSLYVQELCENQSTPIVAVTQETSNTYSSILQSNISKVQTVSNVQKLIRKEAMGDNCAVNSPNIGDMRTISGYCASENKSSVNKKNKDSPFVNLQSNISKVQEVSNIQRFIKEDTRGNCNSPNISDMRVVSDYCTNESKSILTMAVNQNNKDSHSIDPQSNINNMQTVSGPKTLIKNKVTKDNEYVNPSNISDIRTVSDSYINESPPAILISTKQKNLDIHSVDPQSNVSNVQTASGAPKLIKDEEKKNISSVNPLKISEVQTISDCHKRIKSETDNKKKPVVDVYEIINRVTKKKSRKKKR